MAKVQNVCEQHTQSSYITPQVTAILIDLINNDKMADFVTYCRFAVVDDVGLSGCMIQSIDQVCSSCA